MNDVRLRLVVAVSAGLAVVAGVRGARAGEPCARLDTSHDLPLQWQEAEQDLAAQLSSLPPAPCTAVTLSIESIDGAVRVVAQAADRRRAVRNVSDPSLLVATALGLVISIPPDEAAPAASPLASSNPPAVTVSVARRATLSADAVAPVAAAPSRAASVWLGVALGARYGVPSSVRMAAVEASADLRIDRLLLFVSFESAPIGFVAGQGSDGDAYRESSVAFGVGRNFPLASCTLDLSVAPSLVTMRLGRDVPTPARANDVDLRIGALVRLNVPVSPAWRLTFTADTDVIPDALRSAVRTDPLPAFPAWTTGLRAGVSGAIL
jgi:hypothetical protein